jgi:hypothetical protein
MGKRVETTKARINSSVDADVYAYIEKEAASKRLSVSALLNSILAERMESELAKKAQQRGPPMAAAV